MPDVTSNECIAGSGKIPERSDTGEYMKQHDINVQYLYDNKMWYLKCLVGFSRLFPHPQSIV